MKFVFTNLSGDFELRSQLKQLRDVRVGIREAGWGGGEGVGVGVGNTSKIKLPNVPLYPYLRETVTEFQHEGALSTQHLHK